MDDSGIETPPKSTNNDSCSFNNSKKKRPRHDDHVTTVIRDNVHGLIEIPSLCQKIMDTPEFERLRSIKQLGLTHYVYPAARHSRFEHSLGVMHLAGKFVTALQDSSPGCCDDVDKLCVQVAGLCHDLGHGPYSHLWEQFLAEAGEDELWSHEGSSVDVLTRILESIDHNLLPREVDFIKELIGGPLGSGKGWPYKGRGREKAFLYEIVANEVTGVDVDKMDYVMRDSVALGIGSIFQARRYLSGCRVVWGVDGTSRIAVNGKVLGDVCDLYLDRARLHRNAYQHKTIKVMGRMMIDVLLAANDSLDIIDSKKFVRISEAHRDLDHFLQLCDDYVLRSIQHKGSTKAQEILDRLIHRNLYKVVYDQDFSTFPKTRKDCENEIDNLRKIMKMNFDMKELSIIYRNIDYGKKGGSLLKNVVFFKKDGGKDDLFYQHPETIKQRIPAYPDCVTLLVICRSREEKVLEEVRRVITVWSSRFIEDFNISQIVDRENVFGE